MVVTAKLSFVNDLRESQLLTPEQWEEIHILLERENGDPEAAAALVVKRGWITAFQAEQLLQGNGKSLVLGPYVLLELLGEGGMGQVYKAMHRKLNRLVALKVIRKECLSPDSEVVKRFQREAQAAALLSHPNIVLIYDADQIDDTHFIAMEYVEGTDLSKLVQEVGPLPVSQACDFIRQAALGLEHAFEEGMVHRDIKPSNLLLAPAKQSRKTGVFRIPVDLKAKAGDTPLPAGATGKTAAASKAPRGTIVKILDMGLARLIEPTDETSLTREGMVIGTPDYIAPEQARSAHKADIRADLYSLGCTFYFLLTGQPPFPEGSAVEKLLMHQLDEPQAVEERRPDVPHRIAAIVRKLMAKRPDDRYQTPAELAEDLAPYTNLESVPAAAPPSLLVAANATTPRELSATVIMHAHRHAEGSETAAAVEDLHRAHKIASLKGHHGWVMALDFTADRNQLASAGLDGQVRLWGFSSSLPKEMRLPGAHKGEIHALAFAQNKPWLASGSGYLDGQVLLWDLSGNENKNRGVLRGHEGPVEALTFSPDGNLLATGGCDKTVRLWDLTGAEPREQTVLKGHTDFVKAVAFSPDGKTLASGGQDGTVHLWSLGRLWNEKLAVLRAHAGHVLTVKFAPDGKTLASGGLDQIVRLWDLTGDRPDNQALVTLTGHTGVVRLLQYTPKNKVLVSADNEGHVILWELATGKILREWQLRAGTLVSSYAFTYDGRYLATGLSDGSILVYRLDFREFDP